MIFTSMAEQERVFKAIDARSRFAELTEEQNDSMWCMYQMLDQFDSWLGDKEPEEDAPLHERVEYSKLKEYIQDLYEWMVGKVAELYVFFTDSNYSQGLYDDDGNLIPKADKN